MCVFMYVFLSIKSSALQGRDCGEPCSSLYHLIFMEKLDCACCQGNEETRCHFNKDRPCYFLSPSAPVFRVLIRLQPAREWISQRRYHFPNIIISFQEENYEQGSGLEIKSTCWYAQGPEFKCQHGPAILSHSDQDCWGSLTGNIYSSGLVGDLVLKK